MGPSGRGGVMQRPWWGCECMGILMKRLSEFMRMWANDVGMPKFREAFSMVLVLIFQSYNTAENESKVKRKLKARRTRIRQAYSMV
ncbi:hypothetical protein M0802_013504 [Mischocyttarus mexicanus]|nr:hypothetical protein M0802_013504 [Mischocyttarus mexicanus]